MADKTPEEVCDQKGFYLVSLNGIPCLKQNHEHYHRVQLQLYVTRSMAKWCDFSVYSLKGVFYVYSLKGVFSVYSLKGVFSVYSLKGVFWLFIV